MALESLHDEAEEDIGAAEEEECELQLAFLACGLQVQLATKPMAMSFPSVSQHEKTCVMPCSRKTRASHGWPNLGTQCIAPGSARDANPMPRAAVVSRGICLVPVAEYVLVNI